MTAVILKTFNKVEIKSGWFLFKYVIYIYICILNNIFNIFKIPYHSNVQPDFGFANIIKFCYNLS